MQTLEHKTLKAATTATDRGEFTAIAAAYTVDRTNERIIPGAFQKTIEAWQGSGKTIPLHWDHESDPASIIGYVDPSSMEERDAGLFVKGQLDLENSEVAREAWRSMKNNAISLSFGYLFESRKGKDGVKELTIIDLFEITLTPAPVNADSRVLSMKSVDDPKALRKRTQEVALKVAQTCDPPRKSAETVEAAEEPPEVQVDESKIRAIVSDEVAKQVSEVEDEVVEPTPQDPLRKRTYEVALGVSNGGMKVRKRQEPESEPEPEPLDAAELRRRSFEARLSIASGK